MEAPVKSRNCPLSTAVHFKWSDYVSVVRAGEFSYKAHVWKLLFSQGNTDTITNCLWGVRRFNETQEAGDVCGEKNCEEKCYEIWLNDQQQV